jgi:hypothetical protein
MGASPVTTTVAFWAATGKVSVKLILAPTVTGTSFWVTVAKPAASAVNSYVPTGTTGKRNSPFVSLLDVRVTAVAVFFNVSVAPANTPPF